MPVTIESVSADEHIITISTVNGHNPKLYVRSGGSSDIKVFDQIFLEKEYQPLVELIQNQHPGKPVKYIIDAGTNVGYTSVYLKSIFQEAALVCIEPSSANAKQIEKNFQLNNITNYQVIEAGLWSKNCWLTLKANDLNDADWGFYVVESEAESDLKAVTLRSLLENNGWPVVDILKIDIEGSEKELFNDAEAMLSVLNKTRFIAMEIHDQIANREEIYKVLKSAGFDWFESGELTIATNMAFK